MIKALSAKHSVPPSFIVSSPPPIVPQGQSHTFALGVLIAIMSFLASLALGGVSLITNATQDWQGQIAREATLQISPVDGVDMEQSLQQARDLVASFAGITEAYILDVASTQKLLEPWFGSTFTLENLELPRLIIMRFDEAMMPDLDLIRATLERDITGAYLDDHHLWISRLASMAHSLIIASLAIFVLVLSALILSVVFATRATLLMNADIIEVLHFIGADAHFVARQFDGHFLKIGLKGGLAGVSAAILTFWLMHMNTDRAMATAEGYQFALLFGSFSLTGIIIMALSILVAFIAGLTMLTSHSTIIRQLREIDRHQNGF